MPATVSLHLIGVWFCVGLFTAMVWTLGGWISMGEVLALIESVGVAKA